jgi:hypothetical protein
LIAALFSFHRPASIICNDLVLTGCTFWVRYDYPRDQWVDPQNLSGANTVGVSLNNGKSPALKVSGK